MGAVCAMLSPDVFYHNIPMAPLTGKTAVEDYFAKLEFDQADWEIIAIAANGNTVLTERVDRFTMDGRALALPVMGVFEIKDGLIEEWRDYFDLASWRAQLEG
jgi:limonene-1,2-epoxide hydrolase